MKNRKASIYVINLERSRNRKKYISKQLDEIGVNYHIFTAVDGQKGYHPLFENYNETKRIKLKGKILRPGQLGCFASHYLLWQKCIADKTPMIVLEDDIIIIKNYFLDFYNATQHIPDKYECIRLFKNDSKNIKFLKVQQIDDLSILKFSKGHKRTIGYYLTPSGAEKFLKHAENWFLPVDITMDRFWSNKVECYGIAPPCLSFDGKFESNVAPDENKKKKKMSIWVKIRREKFAMKESLKRFLWNIFFVIKWLCKSN